MRLRMSLTMHERDWEMTPGTVEELLLALFDIDRYEKVHAIVVPVQEAPIVTRELFKDIGQRILRLEQLWGLNETM